MMPRKHAGAAAACLLLAAAAPCAGAAIRGSTTLTSALQPAYSDLVSAMSTGGSSPGGGEGGLASGFGSLQTFNETRLADMEVGALPLTQLFTPAGIAAAQKSAGCEGTAWRSRMEAVHGLVEHSYILTLPRPGKFVATAEQAERCAHGHTTSPHTATHAATHTATHVESSRRRSRASSTTLCTASHT